MPCHYVFECGGQVIREIAAQPQTVTQEGPQSFIWHIVISLIVWCLCNVVFGMAAFVVASALYLLLILSTPTMSIFYYRYLQLCLKCRCFQFSFIIIIIIIMKYEFD